MRTSSLEKFQCPGLTLKIIAAVLCLAVIAGRSSAQEFAAQNDAQRAAMPTTSVSYPKGDFYEHLADSRGQSPDACDWGWGCGGSPFRSGPGKCDTWRVGPTWGSSVEGLFFSRPGTDIATLATAAGIAPGAADTLLTDFEHGAGVRALITSTWPQCAGYEVQLGYVGVPEWNASAFQPDTPVVGPGDTQESFTYQSRLHSLELNVAAQSDAAIKPFAGVRYILFEEDLKDATDEIPGPPPAPDGPDVISNDLLRAVDVENNLIGFHSGLRSDLFSITKRLYLQGFVGGGIYCNLIDRSSLLRQTTTTTTADDTATMDVDESGTTSLSNESGFHAERARFAYTGEASLAAVMQVNRCFSGRIGYQVLHVGGVELGDAAFLGLTPTSEELTLHGWFAGMEYRR